MVLIKMIVCGDDMLKGKPLSKLRLLTFRMRLKRNWQMRSKILMRQWRVLWHLLQKITKPALVFRRAQAEAAARRREMDEEAARQFIAEQDAMLVDDDSVVPAEEQIPVAPGPRKMRKRFVNRKGTWLRAQKLKHRIPGEDVFVRESKGQFLKIGVVDQAGRLPVCYLEEK